MPNLPLESAQAGCVATHAHAGTAPAKLALEA